MTAVRHPIDERDAVLAIGTLADTVKRLAAGMNIPKTMHRERAERERLCALAGCISALTSTLAEALDNPMQEAHGDQP